MRLAGKVISQGGGISMNGKADTNNKRILFPFLAVFLALAGLFTFLFFNCIHHYFAYDADKLDLIHETLTFVKYERRSAGKSGWVYDLYFREYEKPFRIDSVDSKAIEQADLDRLRQNDTVKVTFCRNYDEICEITGNGTMVLRLPDYIKANRNNQLIGMIVCPLMVLCALFVPWIFIRAMKPIDANDGLGKLRIEYRVHGNVIRIYNSIHVCSLVINDQIFDQHHGIYGSNFCLKGHIGKMKAGGKTIRVEAKMGIFHMRLYCDDQLVVKKFMVFG